MHLALSHLSLLRTSFEQECAFEPTYRSQDPQNSETLEGLLDATRPILQRLTIDHSKRVLMSLLFH